MKIATEATQKVREELRDKPEDEKWLIHFLNSKNRNELQEPNIEDRIEAIFEIRKVLSKRNLIHNIEEKCHNM